MITRTQKRTKNKKNSLKKEQIPAIKYQQRVLRDFYRKILMIQEEEKRRISRDLHDETGQIVIGFGAALNVIERELQAGNIEKALRIIEENRGLIQEIANKMKSMALNLRPPALDLLGLSAVLREFFSQCTTSNKVKIEFNENLKDIKLNENIEISLYRMIQEATYNILKHSMATKVKVELIRKKEELKLFIEDDGQGFDVEKHKKQDGYTKMGLQGIKERVGILGGDFSIESNLGRGTKLIITLPLA